MLIMVLGSLRGRTANGRPELRRFGTLFLYSAHQRLVHADGEHGSHDLTSGAITGNGTGGLPNGVIFNGTFHGPVTWSLITLSNGTHNYTLSGDVMVTWYNGSTVFGATIQLTINTGTGLFNGTSTISSGDTNIVS